MTDYRELVNLLNRAEIPYMETNGKATALDNTIKVDKGFVVFYFDDADNLVDIRAAEQM